MTVPADKIRLGHVLGKRDGAVEADIREAVEISNGSKRLEPRTPANKDVVRGAEKILGVTAPRPIYAFVGNLHPGLGSVGLIFSRVWAKEAIHGATRCDSGGLYGRIGGFGCLSAEEAEHALRALSTPQTYAPQDWEGEFAGEMATTYAASIDAYIKGDTPSLSPSGTDVRDRCIQHANANNTLDRRLWTWELRMDASPKPQDVFAIILSYEAFKQLEDLSNNGDISSLDRVSILKGDPSAHWLDQEKVLAALQGEV